MGDIWIESYKNFPSSPSFPISNPSASLDFYLNIFGKVPSLASAVCLLPVISTVSHEANANSTPLFLPHSSLRPLHLLPTGQPVLTMPHGGLPCFLPSVASTDVRIKTNILKPDTGLLPVNPVQCPPLAPLSCIPTTQISQLPNQVMFIPSTGSLLMLIPLSGMPIPCFLHNFIYHILTFPSYALLPG